MEFVHLVSLFVSLLSILHFGWSGSAIDQDPSDSPKLWALLAAGSSGYFNYRHQADIAHAYQILKNNGIPDERIIVMIFDDIAHCKLNPTPGVIINQPNGTNVYAGIKKDYTGKDVTPDNFINVLMGNKKAMRGKGSGKVIQSGPRDHIFVNFADHGAPGLLAFPRGGVLHARKLNKAIRKMYRKKKYDKMVFYVEACESGSMFSNILRANLNVYATTAANTHESSYACYYDSFRRTYLGDVYSVNWMQDSDSDDPDTETLIEQFNLVKYETNTSHVEEYGDLSMGKMSVGSFQGNKKYATANDIHAQAKDVVGARDVPIAILNRIIATTPVKMEKVLARRKLKKILKNRRYMNTKVLEIVQKVSKNIEEVDRLWTRQSKLRNYVCYETAVSRFHGKCFSLNRNDYALKYMQKLVNLCEAGIEMKAIVASIDGMCKGRRMNGII